MAKTKTMLTYSNQLQKDISKPEDWQLFKDMLLNLRLAVLTEPKPHAKVRELCRTWYSGGKYRSPICDSTLIRLSSTKKAHTLLDELIELYVDIEEKNDDQ
ncbi:hypothetical protein HOS33_gp293 [Erwinia phage vB_EamM_Y3]|uniref:Uncharacterized protein n=1 Tax=Erwinia phage vB_EamM_Y3 TaxID=1983553 RepID=A0A2H4IBK1_9CAUD|nr:hypothetical protein HOS33_gp293 [Erwinia phage vB_EamM_Y3]ARW58933.1 hypothetical protein Y3_293 [Erwinia phage vB_EamM_Y3]